MSRWVRGEVVKLHQWSDSLFSLFVVADIDPFVAGQFTQIGVGDESKPLFRPYSFVNTPQEEYLEFYFNHVPEGGLTPSLIHMKPQDAIWVSRKASGRFTMQTLEPAKTLWCFATGTGLGVFLSMLKTAEPWDMFSQIRLVHSVSHASFLSHFDVIERIKMNHADKFRFVPIVTREAVEGAYQQRLTQLVSDNTLEKDLGDALSASTSQVMLCGNPHMVKEMREVLQQRDMGLRLPGKGGHVTIESYWKG